MNCDDRLLVELQSYDYSNGVCEVIIGSDKEDLINQFLVSVEREGISNEGEFYDYSYHRKDGKEYKHEHVVIRWLHIDTVITALKSIRHTFNMTKLLKARAQNHPNFAYMNEGQFYCLTDYIGNNLNIEE